MAECLEFGIGISSIVFVEINKYIPPLFFKNEIHSILSLKTLSAKNKAGCYKKNHKTNTQKLSDGTNNLPNSCSKEFTTQKPHPCLLPSEKPSKTKKQRYDSGGQQYCSVAKCACNSEEETEDQILASTSSINNNKDGSLLNGQDTFSRENKAH